MKKIFYVAMTATLGLTSCTQDLLENAAQVKSHPKNLTVTLTAPDSFKTRVAKQSKSDKGGVTNFNSSEDDIRYTLQYIDEDGNKSEKVIAATDESSYTTSLELIYGKKYTLVAFADFTSNGNTANSYHYDANNLNTISQKEHRINDETQDTYFGSVSFTAGEEDVNVTLKRPLAKVRVIKINSAEGIDESEEVKIAYRDIPNYTLFNAFDGTMTLNGSRSTTYTAALPAYNDDAVILNGKEITDFRTLSVDYLYATDTEDKIDFDITWTQNGNNVTANLKEIPIKRNRLTTVYLQNLGDGYKQDVTVTIDENFDETKDLWFGETLQNADEMRCLPTTSGSITIKGETISERPDREITYRNDNGDEIDENEADEDSKWFTITTRNDKGEYTLTYKDNTSDKPRFGTLTLIYPHYTQTYIISQAAKLSNTYTEINITGMKKAGDLMTAINDKVKEVYTINSTEGNENNAYRYVESLSLTGTVTAGDLNEILSLVRNAEGIGKSGQGSLRTLDMSGLTVSDKSIPISALFGAHGGNTSILKTVKMPDGIESIGKTAFAQLKSLEGELLIPSTVTAIGARAFQALPKTASLYITCAPVLMKDGEEYAFYGINTDDVYVPSAAYLAAWTNPSKATYEAIGITDSPEDDAEGASEYYQARKWCAENGCDKALKIKQ